MPKIQDFIGKHLDVSRNCIACRENPIDIDSDFYCTECFKEILIRKILGQS